MQVILPATPQCNLDHVNNGWFLWYCFDSWYGPCNLVKKNTSRIFKKSSSSYTAFSLTVTLTTFWWRFSGALAFPAIEKSSANKTQSEKSALPWALFFRFLLLPARVDAFETHSRFSLARDWVGAYNWVFCFPLAMAGVCTFFWEDATDLPLIVDCMNASWKCLSGEAGWETWQLREAARIKRGASLCQAPIAGLSASSWYWCWANPTLGGLPFF